MHHYINISQLCMERNDRSAGRKEPVLALCNHSSPCREVMKSCKLLQPIAGGSLYQFRTGSEEHNRLRHSSIPTLWFFKICQFWYSSLTPSNFDLRNMVSQRITKNGSDVFTDYRRTAVGQKAVSVTGAKLWNLIPINIRNSNTIVTFKCHMYQHLLEHHMGTIPNLSNKSRTFVSSFTQSVVTNVVIQIN